MKQSPVKKSDEAMGTVLSQMGSFILSVASSVVEKITRRWSQVANAPGAEILTWQQRLDLAETDLFLAMSAAGARDRRNLTVCAPSVDIEKVKKTKSGAGDGKA